MILLCPSAHGLGHRARMTVLRDALRSLGRDAVLVEEVAPQHPPLDMGTRLWDGYERGTLDDALAHARAAWPGAVLAWQDLLRDLHPESVLVDADPAPLAGAIALTIPAAVVSNFTWADVLSAWSHPDGASWAASLYQGADAFALPFELALRGTGARRPIPHLAWPRPRPPRRGKPTTLLALGRGNPPTMGTFVASEPTRLAVPADATAPAVRGPIEIVRVEGSVREAIAAADIVVTKGAYGTVSECIAARVPMLLVRRQGPEDALMATMLTRAGVAQAVAAGADIELPTAGIVREMDAAFADADPRWSTCDPLAAARTILEG